MRWKFSHLKNTCAPVRSSTMREVITGVRRAWPSRRSAAAAISAWPTANVGAVLGAFMPMLYAAEKVHFTPSRLPQL